MYDATWVGPRVIWPPYALAGAANVPDERTGRQIRANYGSKLSMIDHWFGRVLDELDRGALWDDTVVVVLTDHGHYLGERGGIWGKPGVPIFAEMGHIPMMVAWPGGVSRQCNDLTTTVDVHATLCEIFSVTPEHRVHGQSLVPTLRDNIAHTREHALTGVWGREIVYVDRQWRYGRAPADGNRPLSMFSNRWSTMPVHAFPQLRLPRPDRRAYIDYMPGSDVPVIRQPFAIDDPVPFWARTAPFMGDVLFDRREDPGETRNRAVEAERSGLTEALREALLAIDAPREQLERMAVA